MAIVRLLLQTPAEPTSPGERPFIATSAGLSRVYFPTRGFAYSVIIHSIAFTLLYFFASFPIAPPKQPHPQPQEDIVMIDLNDPESIMYLPSFADHSPKGRKPAPARRQKAEPEESSEGPVATTKGFSYPGPQRVISDVPEPTNRFQTLLQPGIENPPILPPPILVPNIIQMADAGRHEMEAPPEEPSPEPPAPKPVETPKPEPPAPVTPKPEVKPVEPAPKPVETPKPEPPAPVTPKPEVKPVEPAPKPVETPKPEPPAPVTPKPEVKPVEPAPKPAETPKPEPPVPVTPKPEVKPVEPAPKPVETPKPEPPAPVTPKPEVKPVEPPPKPVETPKPEPPVPVTPKPETNTEPAKQNVEPGLRPGGRDGVPPPQEQSNSSAAQTGLRDILALSPMPARPNQAASVPAGEARGRFVISPDANLSGSEEEPGFKDGTPSTKTGIGNTTAPAPARKGAAKAAPAVPASGNGSNAASAKSKAASSPTPAKEKAVPGTGPASKNGSGSGGGNGSGSGGGNGSGSSAAPAPVKPAFSGITIVGGDYEPGDDTEAPPVTRAPRPLQTAYGLSVISTEDSGGGLPFVGVFSHEQIYTVYLDMRAVETDQDPSWTLELAILQDSANTGARGQEGLVLPFPAAKEKPVLPANVVRMHLGKMILVYGIINTQGRLEQISVKDSPDTLLNEPVIKALGKWVFRPAQLERQPVAAKILLGIPLWLPE